MKTFIYSFVFPISKAIYPVVYRRSECIPSPCGLNSQCKEYTVGGYNRAACACLPGYIGSPPDCRTGCFNSLHCADGLACFKQQCVNPCELNLCGLNAECRVKRHSPICQCTPGYEGDPFNQCFENQSKPQITPQMIKRVSKDNLDPAPCGAHTIRFRENGIVTCKCRNKYIGNPYDSCYHECESKFECPSNKTCTERKCVDPCLGVCSAREDCYVFNHKASCRPKSSRSECTSNNDCPSNNACDGYKCVDPCLDFCPATADCKIVNQKPTCVCQRGRHGSPYQYCHIHPFGEMF